MAVLETIINTTMKQKKDIYGWALNIIHSCINEMQLKSCLNLIYNGRFNAGDRDVLSDEVIRMGRKLKKQISCEK
jgi:hypothetical protein